MSPAAHLLTDERFSGSWFTARHVHEGRVDWDAIASCRTLSSGELLVIDIARALERGWAGIDSNHRHLIADAVEVMV